MNVAELIALLETVKDPSLEVLVEDYEGFFNQLPVDPVLEFGEHSVAIKEGE